MVETRYVTPDRSRTEALVAAALRAAGQPVAPAEWQWVEHGSANLVVLAGAVAVRVGRTVTAAAESLRAQALVDTLPHLPFAVPRGLAGPMWDEEIVAVTQRRLDGIPHPSGHGDADELRVLLDAVAEVPIDTCERHLATPHAFMGGAHWHPVIVEQAIPLLAPGVRDAALRAADALAELDPVPPALVHGDLAGSNVLWGGGAVTGVIDWDLASAGDPAVDVAALAVWHGWDVIERVCPPEVVRRARVVAATHPLQVIGFSIVNERPEDELLRAAAWASARM
ncbi:MULTISPECIES: aminoglycoside phosphotransferase family protein [Microbacterium]|uniref:aminoglycoside phosphotransferase family protein n=1 Tax=Microbacterium TaxID=33882 RepID=UPI00277F7C7E|nr:MULTISPECIES: aminoglycoside phosphotransferase family protein [Microbacterium]MDQ1075016.1 aminoglycoside phosphotransferase (APT) family kinase protein [Microbacterium sp. SORGH_AS_0969]MDQ1115247.1 aminoglycoside phosphotransferase (APT) family kinase protein [Microbacterium testaceum]